MFTGDNRAFKTRSKLEAQEFFAFCFDSSIKLGGLRGNRRILEQKPGIFVLVLFRCEALAIPRGKPPETGRQLLVFDSKLEAQESSWQDGLGLGDFEEIATVRRGAGPRGGRGTARTEGARRFGNPKAATGGFFLVGETKGKERDDQNHFLVVNIVQLLCFT